MTTRQGTQHASSLHDLEGTNPRYSDKLRCYEQLDTFAVCIPVEVFRRGAQSFGDLSSVDSRAHFRMVCEPMIKLYSKICELALKSNSIRTGSEDDIKSYPRYDTKIVRVPDRTDWEKTIAVILFFGHADCIDIDEEVACAREIQDSGLDEMNEKHALPIAGIRAKHDRRKKNRRKREDPIHALHWMIRFNEGGMDEDDNGRPVRIPFQSKDTKKSLRDIDKLTKLELARIMGSYTDSCPRNTVNMRAIYEKDDPDRVGGSRKNLINPYEACSIHVACEMAAQLGGDTDYCNPDAFRGLVPFGKAPDYDASGKPIYPIEQCLYVTSLGDCVYERLMSLRFPWTVDPSDLIDDQDMLDRVAGLIYESSKQVRDDWGDAYALRRASQQASRSMRLARAKSQEGLTMSRLKDQITKWKEDELDPLRGDSSFEGKQELACKKFEIQMRSLKLAESVFNANGNIPQSLQNICRYFENMVESNPKKNFCMPLPKNFKNLTSLGNYLAYTAMCLESLLGVATLHKEAILAFFAEMELYYGRNFHINTGFIGEAMSGKSFLLFLRRLLSIMGTRLRIDAMSDGFFKTEDTWGFNYKIMDTEELQPSIAGTEKSGDKSGTAQTDKCAAIRGIMTSGKYGFGRLEKGEDGKFRPLMVEVDCQCTITFCMNPPEGGEYGIPANMRSRMSILGVDKRKRKDGSVPGKIIATKPEGEKGRQLEEFKKRNYRDHCVMAMHQLLIQVGALDDIGTEITDHFLVDFLERLVNAGLAPASDIRHFEQERSLLSTICLGRGLWEYCDGETPGFKDRETPWETQDWIKLNKLAHTSIEDLVVAMTLTAEKYESHVAVDAADALCKYMGVKGMSMPQRVKTDAFLQQDRKKAWNKANQVKGKIIKAPKVGGSGSMSFEWKDGKKYKDGKETAESKHSNSAQADLELTYNTYEWVDQTMKMDDNARCTQLCKKIFQHMNRKPSENQLTGWLRTLLTDMTTDIAKPEELVAILKFMPGPNNTMRVCVAKSYMEKLESNKLLHALTVMLQYKGMPEIEYTTGLSEPDRPWLLKTIIPVSLAYERDLVDSEESLEDHRKEWEEKKQSNKIRNHGHVDELVHDIVSRCAVYAKTSGEDEEFYKSNFSSSNSTGFLVTSDLEEYGTAKHLTNTDTTYSQLVALGFGPDEDSVERVFSKRKRYRVEDTRLTKRWFYPECFTRAKKKARTEKKGDIGAEFKNYFDDGDENKEPDVEVEPVEETIEDETSRMMFNLKSTFKHTQKWKELDEKQTDMRVAVHERKTSLLARGSPPVFAETPISRPSLQLFQGSGSGPAVSVENYKSMDLESDETCSGFEEGTRGFFGMTTSSD